MSNSKWAEELAEAYWRRVEPALKRSVLDAVEPVLKRCVLDAVLNGTAAVPSALENWWASAPFGPAAEARPAPAVQGPAGRTHLETSAVAAPKVGPERKRSPRPLKGVSAAAYDIVKRAGRPLTSRELLGLLREWDGRERTEERDNTLLAAMRRMRKAGWLDYDKTHYTLGTNKPRGKRRAEPVKAGKD